MGTSRAGRTPIHSSVPCCGRVDVSDSLVCISEVLSVNVLPMEKLDINHTLRAFNIIREQGVERDGEHHLGGVAATSDFDGYTITMHDDYVTLRILFHNKFELDYSSGRQLDAFIEKLESIARKKSAAGRDAP